MKQPKKVVVRLRPGVDMQPMYRGQNLDCRLFLLGDRHRQLLRSHTEIVYRMSRPGDPNAIAAEVLESAEIQQYYSVSVVNGCPRLILRDAAFRDQYPLRSEDFTVRVTAGRRTVTIPLPLERFRALGTLLPLLAGNHGDAEISVLLGEKLEQDEQEWALSLLATLDAQDFLQRRPSLPNYLLLSSARPRVTFLGHTSILFQTNNAVILTDPLLRNELGSPRSAFDVTRLDLTAICCTHAHWDHCDLETLLRFDKRIPVIIPRVRAVTAFNPPIAPVLRRLGFQDVRELQPWDREQLGDVEMVLVPFHGEQDEPDAVIDHYTYIYRASGFTVYGGVDAYRDTSGDMHEVLKRVGMSRDNLDENGGGAGNVKRRPVAAFMIFSGFAVRKHFFARRDLRPGHVDSRSQYGSLRESEPVGRPLARFFEVGGMSVPPFFRLLQFFRGPLFD